MHNIPSPAFLSSSSPPFSSFLIALPLPFLLPLPSPPLSLQEKFKTGLLNSAEDFKKNVSALAEEFDTNGPFSDATSISEALSYISSIREQLGALKTEEDSLRRGLNIFKIDQPPSHSLQAMDKVCLYVCEEAVNPTLNILMYVCKKVKILYKLQL